MDTPIDADIIWWDFTKFCKCFLAEEITEKKVYILIDTTKSGWTLSLNVNNIYDDLSFLKDECDDVIWSDEHEDFKKYLDELGLGDKYLKNVRDIDGVDKETGKLRYTVNISTLKTRHTYSN